MLTEVKRKKIMKNHRQKQDYEAMEPSKKNIFLDQIQVRDRTHTKHELKRKQLKCKVMDTSKKQAKQKSRTIQNNGHC